MTPVALLVGSGMSLTGCVTDGAAGFGTFSGKLGGVCDAFERPTYQIAGKTPYDQEWADKTTEAGVAGCKWERPAARPAELDAVVPTPAPKPAPKKPTIWSHVRSKFGPQKSVE